MSKWFPMDEPDEHGHHKAWGLWVYRDEDQMREHVAGTLIWVGTPTSVASHGHGAGALFVPHKLMGYEARRSE